MALATGLCGVTAMLALASIARMQYRRVRRWQPVLCGMDPLPLDGRFEFAPSTKPADRIGSALRAWSADHANAELVTPPSAAGPAPAPDPKWKPERNHTPRAESQPESFHAERYAGRTPLVEAPAPKAAAAQAEPTAAPEERAARPPEAPLSENADYYETLQISPNADPETVHRVYRIMASRFHPDNPVTGSLERFLQLREAYQTLSDPALRTAYDANHRIRQTEPLPVFWQKSFVDGIEGETNRRLGVLSLLYHRRRVNENKPGVSLMELEQRMAFPREYLNFALWYLRSKGYVTLLEDNSDYAVTSAGVDFVESCSIKNKVIRDLLTAGSGVEETLPVERNRNVRRMSPRLPRQSHAQPGLRARAASSGGD